MTGLARILSLECFRADQLKEISPKILRVSSRYLRFMTRLSDILDDTPWSGESTVVSALVVPSWASTWEP